MWQNDNKTVIIVILVNGLFWFTGSRNLLNALTYQGSKGGQEKCRSSIASCTEVRKQLSNDICHDTIPYQWPIFAMAADFNQLVYYSFPKEHVP